MYILCAGTDTQKLINMLESMFGDGPEVDLEDLDTDAVKKMQEEADQAEAAAAKKVGKETISNKNLVITKLPLTPEYGIHPNYIPELVSVHEWCDKKKEKVDKFYYHCHVCQHESQNRSSMLTHTRRCLKTFLVCGTCGKNFISVSGLEEHASKVHSGDLEPKMQTE